MFTVCFQIKGGGERAQEMTRKECGGSKVGPGTRCPGLPSGLRLPSPSFQECWLRWDGITGAWPPHPHHPMWDLLQGHPRSTAPGGSAEAFAVTALQPDFSLCPVLPRHSPAGVVSRSSSQDICMRISSSESVSRPKTGRVAKSLVFLIGGQFLPHIEKTHNPMSIQPWITFGGFITRSLFGMFLDLCYKGSPRFIAL